MDVALVMFTEKGERRAFALPGPKSVIGRNTECDIQIPLGDISRRHCEIVIKKDKVAVRDLGSSNGTYVNNRRIQQAEVKAGETLTVGPVIFTVVINGMPAEIKPIRTILQVPKKKPAKKAKKDETGSLDLAGSGELDIVEKEADDSGAPAELEELSKQRKGKP
jgi:pSer/pThr/pTyr-binding forkhead associated (FHA) protein